MTTSHAASSAAPAEKQASKYVLQDWEPNNPERWDSKLAWRTPVRGGAAGPKAQSFPEDDAPYQGA